MSLIKSGRLAESQHVTQILLISPICITGKVNGKKIVVEFIVTEIENTEKKVIDS